MEPSTRLSPLDVRQMPVVAPFRTVCCAVFLALIAAALAPAADPIGGSTAPQTPQPALLVAPQDSIWLLSTRHLTSQACGADLQDPYFRMHRIDSCGRRMAATLAEYLQESDPRTVDVIYIHGNRMTDSEVVCRGLMVYRRTVAYQRTNRPAMRWLIWSWPSEQQGWALRDVRIKAQRTDAQGLYLAWLLREQLRQGISPKLVGFSFGGRVATGSLHALAGGSLAGRSLPGDHIRGASLAVGLLAPAVGADWLMTGGQHGLATQNMHHLTLLYNQSDAILKRYRLLDPVGNAEALGYEGPRSFAPRIDGTPLPVASRNCSNTLGLRHSEADYYSGRCQAGQFMMAMLLKEIP